MLLNTCVPRVSPPHRSGSKPERIRLAVGGDIAGFVGKELAVPSKSVLVVKFCLIAGQFLKLGENVRRVIIYYYVTGCISTYISVEV